MICEINYSNGNIGNQKRTMLDTPDSISITCLTIKWTNQMHLTLTISMQLEANDQSYARGTSCECWLQLSTSLCPYLESVSKWGGGVTSAEAKRGLRVGCKHLRLVQLCQRRTPKMVEGVRALQCWYNPHKNVTLVVRNWMFGWRYRSFVSNFRLFLRVGSENKQWKYIVLCFNSLAN